jgi:predicted TIM-barrel fold metal-dependent hydrolase
MSIDVHTHLWPVSETTPDLLQYFQKRGTGDTLSSLFSSSGLLELMEKKNIERSIVSAIPLRSGMSNADLRPFNAYVNQQVASAGGKLVGFFTVDPFGGNESINISRRSIEESGFRGMKLHPVIQQFYPNDGRLYPIYEEMQNYGIPILFHSGGIGIVPFKDAFGQPRLLDDVACDFPDLPILMGHGGRIWYDETAMMLRKHKNVYIDISTNFGRSKDQKHEPMEWLLYKIKVWAGGFEKVLFGSDYPFYFQDETLEVLSRVQEALNRRSPDFFSDADMEAITVRNPLKFCERFKLLA